MIRVIALYHEPVDDERYEQHVELCRQVPGSTFRHGRVLRTLFGEPELHHYAEFEFPDMDAFKAVADSDDVPRDREGRRRDGRAALGLPGGP